MARQIDLENRIRGENSVKSPDAGSGREYLQREYILVITDGQEDLQAAARYLQENVWRIKQQKNRGLDLVLEAVPNVSLAIDFLSQHLFSTSLVIAQKTLPESSGTRFGYVLSNFDHAILTLVIDPYTIRLHGGGDLRVSSIDMPKLLDTVALELKEMRVRRRSLNKMEYHDLEQLADERRSRIINILLNHGDYVIHGRTSEQVTKGFEFLNQVGTWITGIMYPLQAGDIDTATNGWRLAEGAFNWINSSDLTTFGQDQSIAGGYRLGNLKRLIEAKNTIFGFKRTKDYYEAVIFKQASDFYLQLAERNAENASRSRGKVRQLWQNAKLNVPRVVGVLQATQGGIVFMEYKGFTIYPISILEPGYPNILQEAVDSIKNKKSKLSSDILDATWLSATKSLGFWRANPYMDVSGINSVAEMVRYYTQRSQEFFVQILPVFGVNDQRNDAQIANFFAFLYSNSGMRQEDMSLRMDLRVEHLGYKIPDKPLPTLEDVIEATRKDGTINLQRVFEFGVLYDAGGRAMSVPLHHDLSHLKEHPLIMWSPEQATLYTASVLANQHMFTSLQNGRRNDALSWNKILEGIKSGTVEEFNKAYPGFTGYGKTELAIDVYRDLEEARQILVMRLPRLYIQRENQYLVLCRQGL